MIKDGITYRNLENQVEYLTDYLNTEAQLVELGIKVVGTTEKREDIPEGQYEYGDAYMIGTSEPYIMWVWTRADRTHPQDYWFEVGPFPMPGPQGPKGDGIEQINKWTNGTVNNVTYDTTNGAEVKQTSTVNYTDSTDGSTKQQQFDTTTTLPIVPGKYISMDATSDNKKMEIKIDDTALALDYISIDKTNSNWIPWYYNGSLIRRAASNSLSANSVVLRDQNGVSEFYTLRTTIITGTGVDAWQAVNMNELYRACRTAGTDQIINKTPTNTGTISANLLAVFQGTPNSHIIYDNQTYYRMDPTNAPDGTLNFIHLDSIDDGNGGYKATGKCFSIIISTKAWKVFDLDFGGSTRTTHNLILNDSSTGTSIYFSLTNNRPETYEGAPAGLLAALQDNMIACTVDVDGSNKFNAGMITSDETNFQLNYGEGQLMLINQEQAAITDNMI